MITALIYAAYMYVVIGLMIACYATKNGYSTRTPLRMKIWCNLFALVGYGLLWLPCLVSVGYVKRK